MFESFATVWPVVADAVPDATAAIQGDRRVTWRELDDRAARLASALAAHDVGPGTHVALYVHNAPEGVEAVFACYRLGAVPANVNFRYGSTELAALLDDADAEVLVYHGALRDRVEAVRGTLPHLRLLIEIPDDTTAETPALSSALDYEELVAGHPPLPRTTRRGADRLLWYTGGTTGLPKGVIWEQGTLLEYGLTYAAALLDVPEPTTLAEVMRTARDLRDRDHSLVTLVTTPVVHATAAFQLHATLSCGGTLVMLAPGPVDGDAVCATIERERVVVLSVVGDLVLRRMVDALERAEARGRPYDLSSLRRIHSSGAIVRADTKDALLTRGTMAVYDSLGASEAVGFGLALTTEAGTAPTARFRLGTNARVLDADGRDVVPGSGEAGVLAVAVSTAIGYHDDPERTAATFREIDGRRHAVPGDWAVPHDDGTITLLGRGSACINTGGEKVWPEEVEEVLKEHPSVHDAVVVGLPDDEWGEAVAAIVAPILDTTPTTGELTEWVGARLARYKRPRRVVLVDDVQRTTIGKPDYEWARAQFT